MRTVENWQRVFDGKSAKEAAAFILADLIGYRSSSIHRDDDADSLTNAIVALMAEGEETAPDQRA